MPATSGAMLVFLSASTVFFRQMEKLLAFGSHDFFVRTTLKSPIFQTYLVVLAFFSLLSFN